MGTHDSDCGGRTMADNNGLRLTYFKGSYGRGGPIRDVLTLIGQPFEYEELTFQEFVDRKGDLPFGSLPALRVGGVERTQSNALLMYAGMLTGYYSPHGLVGLMTREVLGAVEDGYALFGDSGKEPDQEIKAAKRQAILEDPLTAWFEAIEALLARNGFVAETNNWAIGGNNLNIADFKLYSFVRMIADGHADYIPTDAYSQYPLISAHYQAMIDLRASQGLDY